MSQSPMRLIKRYAEFIPKERRGRLPRRRRGIYVLYKKRLRRGRVKYDVQYVGMAVRGGMQGRLNAHAGSASKGSLWSHFSAFEVWDNIRDEEIAELEGLFRHLYRKDSRASRLNKQRGFSKLRRIRQNLEDWRSEAPGIKHAAARRRRAVKRGTKKK